MGAVCGTGARRGLLGRRRLSFGAGGLILFGGNLPACDRRLLLGGLADDGADTTSACWAWVLITGGIARDARRDGGFGLEEDAGMFGWSETAEGTGEGEG